MIGFRVDANEMIATGHLMRCMAIALECRKRGEECIFFLAEEKETQRLVEQKLPFRILHSDWKNMDSEKELLVQTVKEEKVNWLVVDSYQANAAYLAYLQEFVPVMYFDDMGQEHYPVSAVLHYSQWPDDESYQRRYQNSHSKVLAGMQYTPLREEFCELESPRKREKSILITTGGTDTYNVAESLLKNCLGRKEFQEYSFHVIVGSLNQNVRELNQLASCSKRIFLHINVSNISDYMQTCELAVSAGGTTMYELCACRIPTVCFSFAENQREFTLEMGNRKIMIYAGDARENAKIAEKIVEGLCAFMDEPKRRIEYADRMAKLVDGKGTKRIVDFLLEEHDDE